MGTQPDTKLSCEQTYRHNFRLFLLDGLLFNVAMGLIGSTTVIPDFVRRLTDSEILIGLSGSLFMAGGALPQIFMARYLVRFERKKWLFVLPNIPIRFVILAFALILNSIGAKRPELLLTAFFVCYGIASFGDGIVSLPWADLIGSSLDGRWRARMLGLNNAISGVIMLLVSPFVGMLLDGKGPAFPNNYALLFGASGCLMTIAIIPGVLLRELPGGKPVDTVTPLSQFMPELLRVLQEDRTFLLFIITRLLSALFMMALPFYIGFATEWLGLPSAVAVPMLIAMQTIGSVSGALLYSWLGAKNNTLCLCLALSGSALLPALSLVAPYVGALPLYLGFLVSGAANSGLYPSNLNWLIGHAHPDMRPIYIGLYNTTWGLVGLFTPVLAGLIAQTLGYRALFAVALSMALCASFVARRYLLQQTQQSA